MCPIYISAMDGAIISRKRERKRHFYSETETDFNFYMGSNISVGRNNEQT